MKKIIILLGLLIIPSFSFATQIGSTTANQNQVLGFDLTNGQAGDFVGVSWINYSSNNVFEITSKGNGNWTYNNGNPFDNIYQLAFLNGYSKGIFFWNNGKLVFHTNFNGTFNFSPTLEVQKFAKVSATDIGNFTNYSFDYTLEDVLNSNNSFDHQVFAVRRGNDGAVVNDRLTGTSRIIYCIGDGTNYYCASCVPGDTYTNSSCNGGTTVIDLGLTKGSTIDDIQNQGLNENSPINSTTPPNTNDVCITVQQLFDMQSNNYYTGLCYSTNKYLTQTGRVEMTPKFITELYPTYTELRQDRNTRQNYCQPPATQQTCQQAFNGKEENRTLLNKIPIGTDLTILYDYCNIYQTRSGNMQKNFCDMTQEEQQKLRPSQMTTEGYAERIAKHPTNTTTPTTGTVYDGLTDGTNRDILEAIPRVYTKITGIFKGRSGKDGIIPYYITGLLLVIVLFKLFKK